MLSFILNLSCVATLYQHQLLKVHLFIQEFQSKTVIFDITSGENKKCMASENT